MELPMVCTAAGLRVGRLFSVDQLFTANELVAVDEISYTHFAIETYGDAYPGDTPFTVDTIVVFDAILRCQECGMFSVYSLNTVIKILPIVVEIHNDTKVLS
jgi:hypothetical protein